MIKPPAQFKIDFDELRGPDVVAWCEGPDWYYIPAGTVDIDAALYLAYKAGMSLAYSQWAKHDSPNLASDVHEERAKYYLAAAQKVAGRR